MRTVTVHTGHPYDVRIGHGLMNSLGTMVSENTKSRKIMVVSDDNVFPLYGELTVSQLEQAGFTVYTFVFPHGEQSKNLTVFGDLLQLMCDCKLSRKDTVLALGGGVVGDLTGFAAATYQRGMNFIQVPTTLLAAVDSSVGGKTAVDLPNGKNQVGCFYQPTLVVCDPDLLKTLPEEEYQNGCAEIIKYTMINDADMFTQILDKPVCEQYEEIIEKCVAIKRDYVEEDEFDNGLRMMLNFGHTIGHGVEAASSYEIPHGRAVAIGMALVSKATSQMGLCDSSVYTAVCELIQKYGLPISTEYSADELYAAALVDKKNTADSMRLIIPEVIGKCNIHPISKSEFLDWLRAGGVE